MAYRRSRSKYNNKKTYIGDLKFDSEAEAQRYLELEIMEKAGQIANLELQPKFPIIINNVKICSYWADFRYDTLNEQGRPDRTIVEDVKGMRTDVYKIKHKLAFAHLGVEVIEIPAKEVKAGAWAGRVPDHHKPTF